MSESWSQNLYLYNSKFTEFVIQEARRIKQRKGEECTHEDFHYLDTLHCKGLFGVKKFLETYCFNTKAKAIDLGCGIGGNSRYLAATKQCQVYSVDYLDNYIECAEELTSLCSLSELIEYKRGDLRSQILPENQFDFGLCVAVFMYIPDGIEAFRNIFKALKPGGVLYWEDYYLLKEREDCTSEELQLMQDYPMPGVRTKNTLLKEMSEVGFEVVEWNEYGKDWSEYVWDKAERLFQTKVNNDTDEPLDGMTHSCAYLKPRIVRDLDHFSPEEVKTNWPNVDKELNAENLVFCTPKFMSASRVVFKKPLIS